MTKRNILCLLLAAALLVQPISLRTWADEVTQQEETVAEESNEAEETEEIIEEPEETQEPAEESEPEETMPEETEDWQEPEEDYEEDYEEVYEDGPFFPGTTHWRSTATYSTAPAPSKQTGAASAAWR